MKFLVGEEKKTSGKPSRFLKYKISHFSQKTENSSWVINYKSLFFLVLLLLFFPKALESTQCCRCGHYINCPSFNSNPAKWYHEPHLQLSEAQGMYESGIFLLLKQKTQTQNDISRVFISSHNQKSQAYYGCQAQLDLCAHVNHKGHVSLMFLSLPLVPILLVGRLFLLSVRRWLRQPNMLHFIKCGSCGGALFGSPI